VIGAPSRFKEIRKAAALARIEETREFSIEENDLPLSPRGESGRMLPYLIALTELLQKSSQFPDEHVRIKF
jgi:hypothetical protein